MPKTVRSLYLFLCLFTVCLLCAAAGQTADPAAPEPETAAYLYNLRKYEGKPALFPAAGQKKAAPLPDADRDALLAGIGSGSEDDLLRVTEDSFTRIKRKSAAGSPRRRRNHAFIPQLPSRTSRSLSQDRPRRGE